MSIWYALVDLLPFQWAEPGSMLFMKNALLAVLIISPLFGLLSTMVVENHMAFFSDALGHSAFTGIAHRHPMRVYRRYLVRRDTCGGFRSALYLGPAKN